MRNREKEINPFEKEPTDYPYKHTLEDLKSIMIYERGGYEQSELPRDFGWEDVYGLITSKWIPWTKSLTKSKVLNDIKQAGGDWYIESIWIEDLKEE